jgi:hypothetical protein
MTNVKPWYKSRGVWGSLATLFFAFSGLAIQFDASTGQFSGNIYEIIASVGTGFAGGLSLWGRLAAKVLLK